MKICEISCNTSLNFRLLLISSFLSCMAVEICFDSIFQANNFSFFHFFLGFLLVSGYVILM